MTQSGPIQKFSCLSHRQRMALPIVAATPSLSEAARLSKVGRRTLYRWLEDEDFREALSQLHKQSADLATAQLQGLMLHAVQNLGELVKDPNPAVRLRAIRTALAYSVRLNEIESLNDELQAVRDSLPNWKGQEE